MLRSVRLSGCLSHNGAFYGYSYRTLIGNLMLEVEPTGCTTTRSGRNGNEAVAGAVSEVFATWLHH